LTIHDVKAIIGDEYIGLVSVLGLIEASRQNPQPETRTYVAFDMIRRILESFFG